MLTLIAAFQTHCNPPSMWLHSSGNRHRFSIPMKLIQFLIWSHGENRLKIQTSYVSTYMYGCRFMQMWQRHCAFSPLSLPHTHLKCLKLHAVICMSLTFHSALVNPSSGGVGGALQEVNWNWWRAWSSLMASRGVHPALHTLMPRSPYQLQRSCSGTRNTRCW